MTSTLKRGHTLGGPVHCNCGIGETRRDDVDLPDRRVNVDISVMRIAFLGILEGFVTRVAKVEETMRFRRNTTASILIVGFTKQYGDGEVWKYDFAIAVIIGASMRSVNILLQKPGGLKIRLDL